MAFFTSDGLQLSYSVYGEGKPILLVHGFASNGEVNWVGTGWVQTLNDAGYQAIVIDNRGHGKSDKPDTPEAYRAAVMAEDVVALIAHLGLKKPAAMGYSMGARICANLAINHPDLLSCVIFGGLGLNMITGFDNAAEIRDALLAPSIEDVSGAAGLQFRKFAESTGSNRFALAACVMGSREKIPESQVAKITVPALVVVGGADEISGPSEPLAEILPKGKAVTIERRDHMRATGDPKFKKAVIDFLAQI